MTGELSSRVGLGSDSFAIERALLLPPLIFFGASSFGIVSLIEGIAPSVAANFFGTGASDTAFLVGKSLVGRSLFGLFGAGTVGADITLESCVRNDRTDSPTKLKNALNQEAGTSPRGHIPSIWKSPLSRAEKVRWGVSRLVAARSIAMEA